MPATRGWATPLARLSLTVGRPAERRHQGGLPGLLVDERHRSGSVRPCLGPRVAAHHRLPHQPLGWRRPGGRARRPHPSDHPPRRSCPAPRRGRPPPSRSLVTVRAAGGQLCRQQGGGPLIHPLLLGDQPQPGVGPVRTLCARCRSRRQAPSARRVAGRSWPRHAHRRRRPGRPPPPGSPSPWADLRLGLRGAAGAGQFPPDDLTVDAGQRQECAQPGHQRYGQQRARHAEPVIPRLAD